MGAVVTADPKAPIYDVRRLHAVQTSLVPESDPELYLPVYPPTIGLMFAPFTVMSYGAAAAIWTLITIVGYAVMVRSTWRTFADRLPDASFVAAAAAAFPPFWNLVINGQNTIVPIAAFYLAWRALEGDRRFLAGLALGLLFFKPQFGLALAVVVLAGGEWAMLAGLAVAAAVHTGVVAATTGLTSLADYLQFMRQVMAAEHLIEPDPFELHSIRSLVRLAPDALETALWLAASAVVLERTVRVWRSAAPTNVRMAVLVIATVLVSPHLFLYDAAILALPLLWLGGWAQTAAGARIADRYWRLVPLLFAAFLFPIAQLIMIQPSVLLLFWLLVIVADASVERPTGAPDRADPRPPSTRPASS